jgi:catechol 2,3-dioxygenase
MEDPVSPPLGRRDALVLSHLGFYVRDIGRMARFYAGPLGFFETERGPLGAVRLVFLSR